MSGIIEWLSGRKTYFVALLIAVNVFVWSMGWISVQLYQQIDGVLIALGGFALRAAVAKGPTQ